MLTVISERGFHMTFKNGNTISVMFGEGNYCENKYQEIKMFTRTIKTSKDAEIAIWNKDDNWYQFDDDNVKGYIDSNEVAKWIDFAANNTF